jgi:GTP-binding protein
MQVHTARFVAGASDPDSLPPATLPEVAFAGRSNVGKSSLLNRLLGRRGLVRVSRTPGRTREINFFAVNEALGFVDLPGYGFARVPLAVRAGWKRLVEGYLTSRPTLRGVVVIVDLRRGLEPDDLQLIEFLGRLGRRHVLVATKADKVQRSMRRAREEAIREAGGGAEPIVFSALTAEGVRTLWAALSDLTKAS